MSTPNSDETAASGAQTSENDPSRAEAATGATQVDAPEADDYEAVDEEPVAPPRRSVVAEACTAIGLLLLGALLLGAQPLQLLAELAGQQLGQGQMAGLTNVILSNGLLAALAAVFGIAGLSTRKAETRPWVQWAATAVVVVGVLFLLVAAVSFPLVPAEQAPPMMPPAPQ